MGKFSINQRYVPGMGGGSGGGKLKAKVLDFNEYAAKNNIPRPLDDHGMFSPGTVNSRRRVSGAQIRELSKKIIDRGKRNQEGREQYNAEVKAGKIRPRTADEHLKWVASGHPDNEATKAAKKVQKILAAAARSKK